MKRLIFIIIILMYGCDKLSNDNADDDNDGIINSIDNCIEIHNPDQKDTDGDGIGDVCDSDWVDPEGDLDGDGVKNSIDNCLTTYNPFQRDADGDGVGDECDDDYEPVYESAFGLYDDFDGMGGKQTRGDVDTPDGSQSAVAGEFSEWLWSPDPKKCSIVHLNDIVNYEVSSGANPEGYIVKLIEVDGETGSLGLRSYIFGENRFETYKTWSADVLLMDIGEGEYSLVMDYHTSIPEQGGLSWYSMIGIRKDSDGRVRINAHINNKNTEYQFWKTLDAELNTWYNLRMDITPLNETELEIQFYVNGVLLASEIPPDGEILLNSDRLNGTPGRSFKTGGTVFIDNVDASFVDRTQ